MQNIWHIIKIWARLFAWNMDSEILSLNRTLSFFFCSCHLHREIARKKAKSGIETSKLCVNKSPLAYTLQRPIQNINYPLQKSQKRQKKTSKKLWKWPKTAKNLGKMGKNVIETPKICVNGIEVHELRIIFHLITLI